MADFGGNINVEILSGVDDDDHLLIASEIVSRKNFSEVVAELGKERQSREAAETSKSELQVSFNRLKVKAQLASDKHDECSIQRDQALREKEEASRANEKLSAELSELSRVKDEAVRAKDCLRSEIETAAKMLVIGIDKISGKVGNLNLTGTGLPRSQKYTGLQAVAYGVIKRTNEIVEELLRRMDLSSKSVNEAREQMEQRNYEIAIEFSQLEAAFGGLSEEVSKKTSDIERLEKILVEKDKKISELKTTMLEKQTLADGEVSDLRKLLDEFKYKFRNSEAKMVFQKAKMVDQLSYIKKIHREIDNVIKIIDGNRLEQSDWLDSLSLLHNSDMKEKMTASLQGMELIHKLSKTVAEKTKDLVDKRNSEVQRLNESLSQFVKEKEDIAILLRSALLMKKSSVLSSESNERLKVTENGSTDVAFDNRVHDYIGDGKKSFVKDEIVAQVQEDDVIYTSAGSLEKLVKECQIEIIELQYTIDKQREEMSLVKQHVEAQTKELIQKKQHNEEIAEKERVANENVEGLMLDIAAAEEEITRWKVAAQQEADAGKALEEITRWKVAAQQEADAGKALEEDFVAQLSTVRQELEEAKKSMLESEKKLKFKEQTADAAMSARDAAEKSLRLADSRTSRIRGKVEALSRQLEQLDSQEAWRFNTNRYRYSCWPWQWLQSMCTPINQTRTKLAHSTKFPVKWSFLYLLYKMLIHFSYAYTKKLFSYIESKHN